VPYFYRERQRHNEYIMFMGAAPHWSVRYPRCLLGRAVDFAFRNQHEESECSVCAFHAKQQVDRQGIGRLSETKGYRSNGFQHAAQSVPVVLNRNRCTKYYCIYS